MMVRVMRETSLEAFADMLSDGSLGDSHKKAFHLVESNPGLTVKELLTIGVRSGLYSNADRNLIAPRITELVNQGIIIRPRKRVCEVSGKSAFINLLAPEEWRIKRNQFKRTNGGKIVKNRIEIQSKSVEGLYHTVIEYWDGSIYCSCNSTYHRSCKIKCHHIDGYNIVRNGV